MKPSFEEHIENVRPKEKAFPKFQIIKFPLGNAGIILGTNVLNTSVNKPIKKLSVAKRKACLQPEKTHGYQYLFTVQFFDSYVYRSRINKGH